MTSGVAFTKPSDSQRRMPTNLGSSRSEAALRSSPAPGSRHLVSFNGKVIGALPPSATHGAIAALAGAGFPANQIQVFTRDDLGGLDARLDRPGFIGELGRLLLGDDLFDLQQERGELAAGDDLLSVPVQESAAAQRVADILHQHGGYGVTHFGRWFVTEMG